MRRSIWWSVAGIVAVLVGSSYLPRIAAGRASLALAATLPARASTWVAQGGIGRVAREIALDASIETLIATSSFRHRIAEHGRLTGVAAVAAVALIIAALAAVARRRRAPRASVWRLARRGESTPRIARRTRLAQDAVRALSGGRTLARRRVG